MRHGSRRTGSFFDPLPVKADRIVLSFVLHKRRSADAGLLRGRERTHGQWREPAGAAGLDIAAGSAALAYNARVITLVKSAG
ncbi:hypothetical protein ACWD0Z_30875 [Streptomyces sp. NPDC003007]